MKEEEFEKEVSRRAGVPRDRARVLIRATLETLADRLTAGEAHDVASQLPKPMKEWLIPGVPEAERFGLCRVVNTAFTARRASPGGTLARSLTRRMNSSTAITTGEFKDMLSQLPDEYLELVES